MTPPLPFDDFWPKNVDPLHVVAPGLRAHLALPSTIVDGIVMPMSQRTESPPTFGAGYKIHKLELCPWRQAGLRISNEPLIVFRPIPNSPGFRFRMPDSSLVRMRAFLSGEHLRAVAVEWLSPDPEAAKDFDSFLAGLQPITVQHPHCGTLTFDPRTSAYRGKSQWADWDVEFDVMVASSDFAGPSVGQLELLWEHQAKWRPRLQAKLIESVLECIETPPTTFPEFELHNLVIAETGDVTFWFSDAGLFGGHSLVLHFDHRSEKFDFSVAG